MNDRFLSFTHDEWAALRANTPMTLDEGDVEKLRGINERISVDEVAVVYLPLSRLLNLYVTASQGLYTVTDTFLGRPAAKVPYIIGVAGSVAVGKSTSSRVLQALLSRWPAHPKVDIVTTDGFLFPNEVLEQRGILDRKGFPESYDQRALLDFVAAVKSGHPEVQAPVYSHEAYDIIPGATTTIGQPDIVIVEGLNVLQTGEGRLVVSDFFDFSLYVDANESDIRRWYVDRFMTLRETLFRDPESYFHRYAGLTDADALEVAAAIWDTVNGVNLKQNILPTRERAHLILTKAADHTVEQVRLRRI